MSDSNSIIYVDRFFYLPVSWEDGTPDPSREIWKEERRPWWENYCYVFLRAYELFNLSYEEEGEKDLK